MHLPRESGRRKAAFPPVPHSAYSPPHHSRLPSPPLTFLPLQRGYEEKGAREKISEAMKRRFADECNRQRISAAMRGEG